MWTPPHFWALALFREGDYARAGVPMLPVVAGADETRSQILIYSLVLVAARPCCRRSSALPGWLYARGAAALGAGSSGMPSRLSPREGEAGAARLPGACSAFRSSISSCIFALHLVERFLGVAPFAPVWDERRDGQKPFSPEDMARRRRRSIALGLVLGPRRAVLRDDYRAARRRCRDRSF